MPYGVKHFNARLDPDKVRAIRATFAEERAKGRSKANIAAALAAQYGVSVSNILAIVMRQTWRRVT